MDKLLAFTAHGIAPWSVLKRYTELDTNRARQKVCTRRLRVLATLSPEASQTKTNPPNDVGTKIASSSQSRLARLSEINFESKESVISALNQLKESSLISKFGSSQALSRRISLAEMQMLTRNKFTPETMDFSGENDAGLISQSFFSTLILSMIAALAVEQYMPGPDYIRYTITFLVAATPFAFLLVGLSIPQLLQVGLIYLRRMVSADFRQRLIYHEAGHFLTGYLLGLPIREYMSDNAITNAVQFYFDFEQNDETTGLRMRVTHHEMDILSIISMSGVVAEILQLNNAQGGYADFQQLQQFMNRAVPSMDSKEVQDKTRWGIVRAYTLLLQNKAAFQALCGAMKREASLAECIDAIESAVEAVEEDPLRPNLMLRN